MKNLCKTDYKDLRKSFNYYLDEKNQDDWNAHYNLFIELWHIVYKLENLIKEYKDENLIKMSKTIIKNFDLASDIFSGKKDLDFSDWDRAFLSSIRQSLWLMEDLLFKWKHSENNPFVKTPKKNIKTYMQILHEECEKIGNL